MPSMRSSFRSRKRSVMTRMTTPFSAQGHGSWRCTSVDAGRSATSPEIGADSGHELLHLPDRFPKQGRAGVGAVGREPVRGHGFDTERPEQEGQDERGSREAVVDDEPEAPRTDRLDVEAVEEVLRIRL